MFKRPKLDRKFDLQESVATPDGAGGFSETWNTLGAIWGDVLTASGRERDIGARDVTTSSYRIIVRSAPHGASSRPTAKQRFVDGSRVFNIHAVSEANDTNQYLVCWVSEGTVE